VEGDAAAVAKALRDYARTNPALVVKGALLGTKALSADEVRALAELPSRDVLLSQVAGAFAAPMQQFAGLVQALPRNFAYGLKALLDERGGVPMEPATEPAGTEELEAATETEAEIEPEPEAPAAEEAAASEPEPEPEPESAADAAEETPEES
jgi:large subunit ribosomal protein L10